MAGEKTVLVIGGPTASGKSGLALSIAAKIPSRIINADSLQLYDGLGTLTAQPTMADRAFVPHRLYGSLDPADTCSAARWRKMALGEIAASHDAGMLPVVVGGTGFYLKTLMQGISPIPPVPPEVRERMIARQKEIGNPAFHAELAARDPKTAARLDPHNTQRLVRAFEVLEATGRPLADWQDMPPEPPPAHLRFILVTLLPPRAQLYAQCDSRFGIMIKNGAMDEVREFMKTATPAMPLSKALGYPELSSHLLGNISLTDAITLAQAATRQYAKRQVTWFRHQMTADLVLDNPQDATRVAALPGIQQ